MSMAALLAQAAIRDRVMPLSVAQYRQLCRLNPGLRKTELIEGLIVS